MRNEWIANVHQTWICFKPYMLGIKHFLLLLLLIPFLDKCVFLELKLPIIKKYLLLCLSSNLSRLLFSRSSSCIFMLVLNFLYLQNQTRLVNETSHYITYANGMTLSYHVWQRFYYSASNCAPAHQAFLEARSRVNRDRDVSVLK